MGSGVRISGWETPSPPSLSLFAKPPNQTLTVGANGLLADRLSHPTHHGSPWTEALLTAAGATVVSLLISFGPLAAAVERLEKPDFRS